RGRSKQKKIYVFIDEAQKVPEAARFFKGVYDSKLNAKLVLTGSSSLEIKAKLKETLAGRKRIFHIPSFSFYEFLSAKDKFLAEYLKNEDSIGEIDQKKLNLYYEEYLIFGGYPRVVLSESQEEKIAILREIFSSYVEKDVVGFLEVKNKTAFNRMIKLLAAQIGQLVNIGELALHLGIDRHTVERYILALEETFVIKKITPYFVNPRQEIIKAAKVYFLDSGMGNLSLENFQSFPGRSDKGSLLENGVCSDLLNLCENRSARLHFWRTKQKTEVDFVIEKGRELLPIEVKSLLGKAIVLPPLKLFIEKFSPQKAVVVNLSFGDKRVKYANTEVDFIYPYQINQSI
ncbi:MAG TPA: ATP-binding protein, partial [Patescibacteria group bacterium]|nr:ATP-binding protein [Patescibacteria group bacterium]